ncbi:class I SAM-dependent methyltransferase [Ectothiorhodospira sp. BSL-9]|uniref:class I SAM-dependent methyltransferase n=1 Tax=Ectothiorhodospira sp. BSL-9 TaxID=1442136 RepID=UPI000AC86783|nr:class I SAM-dependent methyltransferase [Ectothiorhodospira sp. BSL-9]
MDWIRQLNLPPSASIIDVGGGTSRLVDELLAAGHDDLTVLDLSQQALETSRARLGDAGGRVSWLAQDITEADLPPARFDLWHDRAVFHFLTDPSHRQAYVERLQQSVRPGGRVIMATFADTGPERCSGLPVMRYGPESLHVALGEDLRLLRHASEHHTTPTGAVQHFNFCLFERPLHP